MSWHATTGLLENPNLIAPHATIIAALPDFPPRFGESAEGVDVWEICAETACTADLARNLLIVVENQDSQGKKAVLDRLWVEVTYN